jgi:ATP-dependent DNA ligase
MVCDENGLAVFDLIRRHGAGERAVLSAFDLLELDGKDLRHKPIEMRKALLAKLLNRSHTSLILNNALGGPGVSCVQPHTRQMGRLVYRQEPKPLPKRRFPFASMR